MIQLHTIFAAQLNTMKKISILLSLFSITAIAYTQSSGKINLVKGQRFVVESTSNATITQEAMGQSIDVKIDLTYTNAIEVKDIKDNGYVLTNTIIKLKMNTNTMGQETNYDSEKKEDQNTDIGQKVNKMLNVPKIVEIDKAGKVINSVKTDKTDTAGDIMANIMQNLFGADNGSEGLNLAFHMIPSRAVTGFSWSDSVNTEGNISHTYYTIKELKGNEALIDIKGDVQISKKTQAEGMDINSSSTGTVTGDESINISTGIIRQKNTTIETKGNVELMGQQMPITTRSVSKTIVTAAQ